MDELINKYDYYPVENINNYTVLSKNYESIFEDLY